jgi:hypothetical protein
VTVYEPNVLVLGFTTPVIGLIISPVVEENVPPVVKLLSVGVAAVTVEQ